MKKIFQDAELDFFEEASFDRNPLHRDPSYARQTQFGQRVVYGVYAALFGLGEWLTGRNVILSSIKGEFKKPLLLDQVYDLTFLEKANTTDIVYSRSGAPFLKLRIAPSSFADAPFTHPNRGAFLPRLDAAHDVQYGPTEVLEVPAAEYRSAWNDALNTPPTLRLRHAQLPFEQLTALLWSSYFVGMEVPGRQALYSSFEFNFDTSHPNASEFHVSPVRVEMDRRFNRLRIEGTATGVRAFTLSSFERPKPAPPLLTTIRDSVGSGHSLAGKRVLITGGSRGFGATLAQAFALQGAQVLISFLQSRQEAERLADGIATVGLRPILLQGDASSARDWESLAADVGVIDLLICNASPVNPALKFGDQSASDFIAFVDQSLGMLVEPCAQLIPKMNRGGKVIHISSAFVKNPEPGFSHYIAAKAAAEATMRSLALENGDLQFLIFRAPRMLTDQTNTAVPMKDVASPVHVAKTLLAHLDDFAAGENVTILDP